MRRIITLLALVALVTACTAKSPSQRGEEYGATIKQGSALAKCVMESHKRYEGKDREAFYDACYERANR